MSGCIKAPFGAVVQSRGRPRAPEPGSSVSTWIPVSYHDRLVKVANLHDMSVSAYVGRIITREIDRAIE